MLKLLAICAAIAVMKKVEAGHNGAGAGASAGAGAYAGGYGGGYAADYADYDAGYGSAAGLNFGAITNPYAFHQQLTSAILNQHAAQQHAIVSALAQGGASVFADASSIQNNLQALNTQHMAVPRATVSVAKPKSRLASMQKKSQKPSRSRASYGAGNGAGYGTGYGTSYGSGIGSGTSFASRFGSGHGSQAAAAGSIGPDGIHQTAYINPANAASPNIVNRFGGPSEGGGFKSVSVSSFSSSSDAGQKRGASTIINDNGKITKYSVHS